MAHSGLPYDINPLPHSADFICKVVGGDKPFVFFPQGANGHSNTQKHKHASICALLLTWVSSMHRYTHAETYSHSHRHSPATCHYKQSNYIKWLQQAANTSNYLSKEANRVIGVREFSFQAQRNDTKQQLKCSAYLRGCRTRQSTNTVSLWTSVRCLQVNSDSCRQMNGGHCNLHNNTLHLSSVCFSAAKCKTFLSAHISADAFRNQQPETSTPRPCPCARLLLKTGFFLLRCWRNSVTTSSLNIKWPPNTTEELSLACQTNKWWCESANQKPE